MSTVLPKVFTDVLTKIYTSRWKPSLGLSLAAAIFIFYRYRRHKSWKNAVNNGRVEPNTEEDVVDVEEEAIREADQVRYPPGPECFDLQLGNIKDIAAAGSLHEYLEILHKEFRSDIVSFWYGETRMYSIASVSAFKHHRNLFDKSSIIFRQFVPLLTDRSLLFANGRDAQDRRKVYDKCFSNDELVQMMPVLNEAGDKFLHRIAGEEEESRDLTPEIMYCTIYAVSVCTFGDFFKDERKTQELLESYDLVMRVMESRLVEGDPPPGSEKEKEFQLRNANIRKIIYEAIQYRKAERAENKFLKISPAD